ncbi:MAG: hypothetical protein HQ503_01825 [Rhodospirillales bacterium]|nr:hypothetical protein [Rhodospirillales bacterium]
MKTGYKFTIAALAVGSVIAIGAATVGQAHESKRGGYSKMGTSMGGHMGMSGHRGMSGRMGGGMGTGMMEQFDADKDGTITAAEIAKLQKDQIAKYDKNGDGKLSLDEFQGLWTEHMKERMVDHFQALDNDGDALVTEAEIGRITKHMTDRMDRNRDGNITQDEMQGGHRMGRHHNDDDNDDDNKKR